MKYWKPEDLLGFANLYNTVLQIEEAQPWPGTGG